LIAALAVSIAVNMALRWVACVLVSGDPTGRQSERSQSAASLSARYAGSSSVFGYRDSRSYGEPQGRRS
jgi:hypothetical protein